MCLLSRSCMMLLQLTTFGGRNGGLRYVGVQVGERRDWSGDRGGNGGSPWGWEVWGGDGGFGVGVLGWGLGLGADGLRCKAASPSGTCTCTCQCQLPQQEGRRDGSSFELVKQRSRCNEPSPNCDLATVECALHIVQGNFEGDHIVIQCPDENDNTWGE